MDLLKNIYLIAPEYIYAIILFIVGAFLSKKAKDLIAKLLVKKNVDKGLSNFLLYAAYAVCLILLIVTCLDIAGIPTMSFIAIISASGLAIGLAFKETLSNVASGLMILFFKPFVIGDYIAASGVEGNVSDIHIFSTKLKTPDNKAIIIPNFKLTNENVINYTHQDKRRIDLAFGVSYSTDIKKVKEIFENIIKENELLLEDPEPIIGLNKFNENSMEIVFKPWVKTDDYWNVYYKLMETIKEKFDENNIEIPLPQRIIYNKDMR